MIDSTLEFVNKTTSNSLFMFLFCNLIIILILMGNSKPGTEDESNTGSKEPMLISDSVLSSKSMLLSTEPTTLTSKPGLTKPVLISESVLSSEPVLVSESALSSKPGFEKSELISDSALPSNPGLQEPGMISKSVLPSFQPAGSDQALTSKSGLNVMSSGLRSGSEYLKKDEKGRMRKKESSEVEKESLEVEYVLRKRVEEFIRKVNTQWKSENTNRGTIS